MLRHFTYLLLATLALSDRSHADEIPESSAPHDETELRAGMFGLSQDAAARRRTASITRLRTRSGRSLMATRSR